MILHKAAMDVSVMLSFKAKGLKYKYLTLSVIQVEN